jgi:acyl-CoA synthetase (AMP-forming)/AMP-acid ligase II
MGVTPDFVAAAASGLGAQVKRSYGATEIPTIATCRPDDPVERCRETDGRALGEGAIRTVDPATGRDVGPDEPGEVWYRGPEMFVGYLDAEDNRGALERGWFRTGDRGVLDADGWLRIVGRLSDVIIRGGENIAPAEVERVLEEHPAVRQAVVVGAPDDRLGERVAAVVVADGAFDLATCRAWFAERGVARFKVPEVVVALDAMPTLPAGKPDLVLVRAEVARAMAGTP